MEKTDGFALRRCAAWMARVMSKTSGTLPRLLAEAKTAGLAHIDQIIRQHALPRGWPPEIARKYLTHHLNFDIGQRQIQAIKLFHELAHVQGCMAAAAAADLQIGRLTATCLKSYYRWLIYIKRGMRHMASIVCRSGATSLGVRIPKSSVAEPGKPSR